MKLESLIGSPCSITKVQTRLLLDANVGVPLAGDPRRLRLHSEEEQQKHLVGHFHLMTKVHGSIKTVD